MSSIFLEFALELQQYLYIKTYPHGTLEISTKQANHIRVCIHILTKMIVLSSTIVFVMENHMHVLHIVFKKNRSTVMREVKRNSESYHTYRAGRAERSAREKRAYSKNQYRLIEYEKERN